MATAVLAPVATATALTAAVATVAATTAAAAVWQQHLLQLWLQQWQLQQWQLFLPSCCHHSNVMLNHAGHCKKIGEFLICFDFFTMFFTHHFLQLTVI